ncbi:MAG TPA: hypothetical protein VMM60_18490 [Ilumatobacter sp.]|nr:hypothetical protein [Ilumatobacter sp.]
MATTETSTITSMITTGATGQTWRASITGTGSVLPWDDDSAAVNWFVAADDRWHVPSEESTVRQVRLEGTPVTETRVRVPQGDVVQRVYTVADSGGITVIEVENESTLPVAIAFDQPWLLTERPLANVPINGIDLPAGSFVMPLGHAAVLRVGIPHRRDAGNPGATGPLPRVSPSASVVRGWLSLTDRASRFVLPDGDTGAALVDRVRAQRCELALGSIPSAGEDAAGYAIALGELVRMGESPDHWVPELADAVEQLGSTVGWIADVALTAAGRVLVASDERRARRDLQRIIDRRVPSLRPATPPAGVGLVPWLEHGFATGGQLLPFGIPTPWLGQSFEVYNVPTGDVSAVSFAVRWHGERPAALWEQHGEPVTLSGPVVDSAWSTTAVKGEALWQVPEVVTIERPDEGMSFS